MGVFKEIYIEDFSNIQFLGEDFTSTIEAKNSLQNIEVLHYGDIQCGFPSPAADYMEQGLNLHDFIVKKPAATFFMRAKGDSMIDAGIFPNDLLVIDRSINAKSGHIVVASINGDMTLKRLLYDMGSAVLLPENKNYKAIKISTEMDFQVFGVLTCNLHLHT